MIGKISRCCQFATSSPRRCTEDTIRETPLLEFYFAGARYRRALDTLLNEAAGANVRPEQIKAFRDRGAFTLE
jgi:hypothetical protein